MSLEPPLDHAGIEVLPHRDCLALLETQPIGRLGFVDDGQVSIFPVRYMMDSGHVVFRSAVGAKLDAAVRWQAVAFEVDGWDKRDHTGWSVLVHGIVNEVINPSRLEALEALEARGLDEWVSGRHPKVWIEVRPVDISGRRIPVPLPPIG